MRDAVTDSEAAVHASVARLWEIAIKVRLRKLALGVSPTLLPELMQRIGLQLLLAQAWTITVPITPEQGELFTA